MKRIGTFFLAFVLLFSLTSFGGVIQGKHRAKTIPGYTAEQGPAIGPGLTANQNSAANQGLTANPGLPANQAADALEAVRQRGVLLVGTAGDYMPMSYLDPVANKYVGFDAELAEDLARQITRQFG